MTICQGHDFLRPRLSWINTSIWSVSLNFCGSLFYFCDCRRLFFSSLVLIFAIYAKSRLIEITISIFIITIEIRISIKRHGIDKWNNSREGKHSNPVISVTPSSITITSRFSVELRMLFSMEYLQTIFCCWPFLLFLNVLLLMSWFVSIRKRGFE